MLDNGNCEHQGFLTALISRLPDWAVQSVLPIAIHRLVHGFYPLASLQASMSIYLKLAFAMVCERVLLSCSLYLTSPLS